MPGVSILFVQFIVVNLWYTQLQVLSVIFFFFCEVTSDGILFILIREIMKWVSMFENQFGFMFGISGSVRLSIMMPRVLYGDYGILILT